MEWWEDMRFGARKPIFKSQVKPTIALVIWIINLRSDCHILPSKLGLVIHSYPLRVAGRIKWNSFGKQLLNSTAQWYLVVINKTLLIESFHLGVLWIFKVPCISIRYSFCKWRYSLYVIGSYTRTVFLAQRKYLVNSLQMIEQTHTTFLLNRS